MLLPVLDIEVSEEPVVLGRSRFKGPWNRRCPRSRAKPTSQTSETTLSGCRPLRLKNKHAAALGQMSREVNFVWNYSQDLALKVFERERRFLRAFDIAKFNRGATREGRTSQLTAPNLCRLEADGQRVEDCGGLGVWTKVLGVLPANVVQGLRQNCRRPKAIDVFKDRVRIITRRMGGRSMEQVAEGLRECLPGWKAYFKLAQTPQTFKDLDSWIRHCIRSTQLKQ